MANFDGNFKFVGKFNISRIKEILLAIPEAEWNQVIGKIFVAHKQSFSLFLKNDIRVEHHYGTFHKHWNLFKEELNPILKEIADSYSQSGYFIRIQFSKHPPGQGFAPHDDSGFSKTLMHSHRIHLCIQGGEGVDFSVGGETKSFQEGEAWEINNFRTHAGKNNSSLDRINMIIDYATPFNSNEDLFEYFANLHSVFNGVGLLNAFYSDNKIIDQSLSNKVRAFFIRITDKNGKSICDNFDQEPFKYVPGAGQIPKILEEPINRQNVGDEIEIPLDLTTAYGDFDPSRIKPSQDKIDKRVQAVFDPQKGGGHYKFYFKMSGLDFVSTNHPFGLKDSTVRIKVIWERALEESEVIFSGGMLLNPANEH